MSADLAGLAAALGRPLTPWQEQVAEHVLSGRPLAPPWGGRRTGRLVADRQVMALVLAAGWHWHFLRPGGTWCTGPDYCDGLNRMEAPL